MFARPGKISFRLIEEGLLSCVSITSIPSDSWCLTCPAGAAAQGLTIRFAISDCIVLQSTLIRAWNFRENVLS